MNGALFHGEFTSTDASAGGVATIYTPGATAALTVNASDYLVITDITVSSNTTLTVSIYDGADTTVDAGEKVGVVYVAANTSGQLHFPLGRIIRKGDKPRVKASASGDITVLIDGFITTTP